MTFLSSAYNIQSLQKNSVYPDLLSEEMDALYSAYGDDTGVQCALRYWGSLSLSGRNSAALWSSDQMVSPEAFRSL